MGQLLMELSILRDEITDLRERVAGLTVRHAVVSRAPGDPTRRRLRRSSRYRR